ncbi:unnamed protein product [Prunus armeniaca]
MTQIDRLYSADDLYTIRQEDNEPLREYAAMNTLDVQRSTIEQPLALSKVASEHLNFTIWSTTAIGPPMAN